jgi:predicted component of type VI protein secretion system
MVMKLEENENGGQIRSVPESLRRTVEQILNKRKVPVESLEMFK